MKRMTALMLATVLCFGLFSGCSSDPYPSDGSQSATVPYDIVEGLAYTFAAKNQASIAYAQGSSPDDGRLNDGKVFDEGQLDEETHLPFLVQLDACKGKEYQITFETDGKQDACAVVLHNGLFTMSSSLSVEEIAIGDTLQSLTPVEFEEDTDNKLGGGFADTVLTFDPLPCKIITITFSSGGANACAFSEISVMGFPANQAAVYLPEGWKRGDTLPTPSTVVIATSSRDVSSKDEPSTLPKKPQSGDKPENRPEELPDGKLTKAENALVGSWQGTDPESGDAVTMDLYSDRSGYMVQTGDNATVRLLLFWQADDGNMTLYFNFLGYRAHNTPYTVSGNTVAFQDEDGRPTTFTRVK